MLAFLSMVAGRE